MRLWQVGIGAIGCVAIMARPALAQSRPLATEDPEVLSAGQMAVEAGVDYDKSIFYPASGLQGNLWRVGTFGLDFGVSSMAEIAGVGRRAGLPDDHARTAGARSPTC